MREKKYFITSCEDDCPYYDLGCPSKCKYYEKHVFVGNIIETKKPKWCAVIKITLLLEE